MKEGTATCLEIILAIIFPPLGVICKFGCGCEFWLCLLLTFLFVLPGLIYAVYVITKQPSPSPAPQNTIVAVENKQ